MIRSVRKQKSARFHFRSVRFFVSRVLVLVVALSFASGCQPEDTYDFGLPAHFPSPRVPDDNPMTEAKVELGRHLFYDTRLSLNETQSCGSCHEQSLAFTDGLPRGLGSTGAVHPRSSMGLANIAYAATLTWANPILRRLEEQALVPMFGEEPVELGMAGEEDELLRRLRADAGYGLLFPEAFPDDADPVSVANVTRALASFQRSLISATSRYDQFLQGDADALTESEKRGLALFNGETLDCFHCHGGFNFASAVDHENNVFDQAAFNNNGLYNVDGRGAYPAGEQGLYEFTGERADQGRFKAPTLRNIAVTAPYMHDGSIETLEEVIDHYAAGGRNVTEGPEIGDGRASPNKSTFVDGFVLTEQDRADVLAFLRALTDDEFLNDPRHSDPFE